MCNKHEKADFNQHLELHKLHKDFTQKDFLIFKQKLGDTIASKILESVVSSRRTVLILSPAFIKSKHCRCEFKIAFETQQLDKNKRKKFGGY